MAIRSFFQDHLAISRFGAPGWLRCRVVLVVVLMGTMGCCFAQNITLNEPDVPVENLLGKITEQCGLYFSYSPRIVDPQQRLSFAVNNASLTTTLDLLTEKLNIGYTLLDNQIVLHQRQLSQREKRKLEPTLYSISGYINDATSGETLIGATVSVEGTSKGASTNAFGFYSLQLPAGKHALLFSYVGFEAQRLIVQLAANQKKNVPLQPTTLELPKVVIQSSTQEFLTGKYTGNAHLAPGELSNMPEFGGESGLIRGLQTRPGIKAHSDGSAFFFVRGGAKDQNLVLIDDAPIYNPAHLFGFYSVVVPDFAKSITVHKSSIPVHLSDRLSSVVDIRTKDGNLNKTEFSGAFNPVLLRVAVEGPVKKGKSSYFLAVRNSNLNWLLQTQEPKADMRFNDFNLKWNFKFGHRDRLYYTLFVGNDRLANNSFGAQFTGAQWGNLATTIRWNHLYGTSLFSNTTVYAGSYNYQLSNANNAWKSGIAKVSLKTDFNWYHRGENKTRFGGEISAFTFNPGTVSGEDFTELLPNLKEGYSRQSVLYANRLLTWRDRWMLDAGLRFTLWQNLGPSRHVLFDESHQPVDSVKVPNGEIYQTYWNLDPRVSLQYRFDTSALLQLNYGIYHQYLQQISNSVSPFTAFEVWVPSGPNIQPQSAHQVSLGFVKRLKGNSLELNADLYYKKMRNQIDYVDHANTLLNPLLEGELRFGQMDAYGVELLLKKPIGRLTGWVSYTWSRALRQTDAVNEGREYPAFHDRPHDLSLMLNYPLRKRILFSAYWTWYTGSAFSSPTGFYTFNHSTIPIYSEKHNDRLPNYKRLDIAFKFILNKSPQKKYRHSITFSIYNLLASKNIVAVNFNKSLNRNGKPVIESNALSDARLVATQADLIRFLPSLTYKFKL